MEKQKVLFGIIATIACSLLMISGCTQQQGSDHTSTESLQTILAKVRTIESVYYELTMSISSTISGTPKQNTTIKIWEKIPYLKEEISSTIGNFTTNLTVIKRPEGIYRYNITQNKYELTPEIILPQYYIFIRDTMKYLLSNQTTITTLGTETINGKTATVIQYSPSQTGNSTTMKMWIWNEKGIPLKALLTTIMDETITVTMDYQYNNYSFLEIPDSTFSVE